MLTLGDIEFHTTVAELTTLPPADRPEVALVGRSNAGKSSALNALSQRNRIAFVSKTPGRTQHLNFFNLNAHHGYLVDLPGYGYASVPGRERHRWGQLTSGYLQSRSTLQGVVLIMDVRRPLTALDQKLIAWLRPDIGVHILLSKADKLSRHQALAALHSLEPHLARHAGYSAQLFSSKTKLGVAEATEKIKSWLKNASATKK